MWAVSQVGAETNPQGQQQTPQQPKVTPVPRMPVYCEPNVMAAMKLAYQTAQMKNLMTKLHDPANISEGGFPVYQTPNGAIAGNGPANTPLSEQIQYGPETGFGVQTRSNAVAVFHTHPGNGLPSSPGRRRRRSGGYRFCSQQQD